ncbi:AbrB/MazE/SpoVT family DNA-binding domain-containing protein [Venenivibrio stagnispumantis]|uniref:Antitoxin MazE n=1 Tax=Venenivibrio stagnispumantis TaxID=407998 RepID=A0AA46ACQ8_9AQUI|nr:AbrB/MazE/SpoVT family DNA-binding domain-containing protein [Venenivibrio stagnispumantis]MCW4572593.1 AbrB/MazE/SpoVT family DNA-binding domain-containing protein [Venenivibrio stagnispumantis]SMP00482.1 antitoxin MazE [Venenivibrio stagnispumantis]
MITINKWGNSQGIRIPKNYLKKLGLDIGDEVEIRIEDEKLIIVPVKKKRKSKLDINKLFKEKYEENEEYNWGQVGKEIW